MDDATNAQHTDHGDPSMEDARTLLWLQQGEDECRKHVGDIYVNSDDPDKRFSWAYLEEEGRFFWKALEQTAHLKINMLPFPSRNAVEQEIDRIVLTDRVTENGSEKDVDLSNYFSKDINEWDLEFNGNTRDSVSAMYIQEHRTGSWKSFGNRIRFIIQCYFLQNGQIRIPNYNCKNVPLTMGQYHLLRDTSSHHTLPWMRMVRKYIRRVKRELLSI